MQADPSAIIEQAIALSGIGGYRNAFRTLGGGEFNDTYVLDFENDQKLILRIAKYEEQTSLINEARALRQLNIASVPRLAFFDENKRINAKLWVLESYVSGSQVPRLNLAQFASLGSLLANVHKVQAEIGRVNAWSFFLRACQSFGDEQKLLIYPDPDLRKLVNALRPYTESFTAKLATAKPALVHGDATPSNVLVDGDKVGLIDWEFSSFNDPMAEFSTIYYDDMEYNRGKWRLHITDEERITLFRSYEAAGGTIDEERIQLWMIIDKLGAAIYLYWRLNESGRQTNEAQRAQYQFDLKNLVNSLNQILP